LRPDQPLDEERQLRVRHQVGHPDLAPAQVHPVRAVPVARHPGTTEPGLDRRKVGDGDHPAEPAAALVGPGLDCLPERLLVRCRVLQGGDDLQVGAVAEGENEVAGAEPGVQAAIGERCAQRGPEPLHRVSEVSWLCGVGHMVEAHPGILPHATAAPARG
jgi:hypothetical protein